MSGTTTRTPAPWRRLVGDTTAVLGTVDLPTAGRWLGGLATGVPEILRTGRLGPADRAVGPHRVRARLGTGQVALLPGTQFGAVRELYCRNVYLRRGLVVDPDAWVVDLGANRGMFTTLAAVQGARVLAVEAQPGFRPDIERLAAANRVADRVHVVTAMVKANREAIAAAGVLADPAGWRAASHSGDSTVTETTMNDLVEAAGIARIGLLKVDIEGGEFSLFDAGDDLAWLDRVGQITMEVHPAFGTPPDLVSVLEDHGFTCELTDNDGTDVPAGHPDVAYLYARRS